MRRCRLFVLSLIIISCSVHKGGNPHDRNILRVRENGVNLSFYTPFAKRTQVAVLDTLSSLRFETDLPLLDGVTPPSKKQLEAAEQAGVSFRYTAIGREAFVFFVNSQIPVEDLTVEQLQAIYAGEITNWRETGGKEEPVRPFQRNENSGSQTAFVHFMHEKTIMEPPVEDVVEIMSGIVSQTADYANYGNALGYSFRFYVNELVKNREVKILKVNGVYPDLETIRNGVYPLSSPFFAVTLADNDKPNVLKFLDWTVSEQGQYLVGKTGYCPTK
jgi:phosphate transport system substrate-binding protein